MTGTKAADIWKVLRLPGRGNDQRVWTCPEGCGWTRTITVRCATEWIIHPIYGRITVLQGVDYDIRLHECAAYRAAKQRAYRATQRQGRRMAARMLVSELSEGDSTGNS